MYYPQKYGMAYIVLYLLDMICERFPGVGEWADMGFISSLGIVLSGSVDRTRAKGSLVG